MKTKDIFFAFTRIALGWVFLWAFLDKTFGLGISTAKESAWLFGTGSASPTAGFLSNATQGPFADFFSSLSGQLWVDWLFMIGLLLIGVGLILGIAMRLSAFFGAIMMILMFFAVIPLANNPFVDDHVVYALILLAFMNSNVGDTFGFGKQWKRTGLVKKLPIFT